MEKIEFKTGGQPIRLDDLERIYNYSDNLKDALLRSISTYYTNGALYEGFLIDNKSGLYTVSGSGPYTFTIKEGYYLYDNGTTQDIYKIVGGNTFTGSTSNYIDNAKVYLFNNKINNGGTVQFYDLSTENVWFDNIVQILHGTVATPTGAIYLGTFGNKKDLFNIRKDLIPYSTNTYDIGTSTLQFRNGYFDGTITTDGLNVDGTSNLDAISLGGSITPTTTNTYDLGTSSLQFRNGYFDGTVYMDALDLGGNITGNIIPSATNTYTLGSSTNTYSTAYLNNVSLSGKISGDILPGSTNTYDLGSTSYKYADLYIDNRAYIKNISVYGEIVPTINNSYNIGSSSFQFNNIYTSLVRQSKYTKNIGVLNDSSTSTEIINNSIYKYYNYECTYNYTTDPKSLTFLLDYDNFRSTINTFGQYDFIITCQIGMLSSASGVFNVNIGQQLSSGGGAAIIDTITLSASTHRYFLVSFHIVWDDYNLAFSSIGNGTSTLGLT